MAVKDAVLSSAVDVARAAAEEVAEEAGLVGEHLGLVVEGERLISHRFAATAPGYRGWFWSVTVARVPRARSATVCEVDLLPGTDAVLAPTWVPWSERLQPGDVGPTDTLPLVVDDDRLEQGYEATGDEDADALAIYELGLGRERVLSPLGRGDAAERWYAGTRGPLAPQAVAAAAPCSTCGFLLLMAGSLRTSFGVCANEWSPDDGRVVSMDHGCGAHSQTDIAPGPSEWPDPAPVIGGDEELELVELSAEEVTAQPGASEAEGTVTPEAADLAPAEDVPALEDAEVVTLEDATDADVTPDVDAATDPDIAAVPGEE